MELTPPSLSQLDMLTELCLRSKAIWGYNPEFIEACRDELTLTEDNIKHHHLQIAVIDNIPVGIVEVSIESENAELEKLFIDPDYMKKGIGRALFEWGADTARIYGATRLIIDSDPGAASFYQAMGAIEVGRVPSGSIPGRFLPRFILDLSMIKKE